MLRTVQRVSSYILLTRDTIFNAQAARHMTICSVIGDTWKMQCVSSDCKNDRYAGRALKIAPENGKTLFILLQTCVLRCDLECPHSSWSNDEIRRARHIALLRQFFFSLKNAQQITNVDGNWLTGKIANGGDVQPEFQRCVSVWRSDWRTKRNVIELKPVWITIIKSMEEVMMDNKHIDSCNIQKMLLLTLTTVI